MRPRHLMFIGLFLIALQPAWPEGGAPTPPKPSPMMEEIHALLDAEEAALADLQENLQTATDGTAMLAIIQEVERVKKETELDILHVQLRYAREGGHEEAALRLEEVIESLTHPRPVQDPEPRPRSER